MNPVLGAILTQLGVQVGNWLLNKWLADKELERRLRKWATEGIFTPSEQARLYGAARGQAVGTANALARQAAAIMGAQGLSGGVQRAVERDIARSVGASLARDMAQIAWENARTRAQGIQNLAAYRLGLSEAKAKQQQALSEMMGYFLPGKKSEEGEGEQASQEQAQTQSTSQGQVPLAVYVLPYLSGGVETPIWPFISSLLNPKITGGQ